MKVQFFILYFSAQTTVEVAFTVYGSKSWYSDKEIKNLIVTPMIFSLLLLRTLLSIKLFLQIENRAILESVVEISIFSCSKIDEISSKT